MELAINFWAVLLCGVLAMAVGSFWHGALFGRKYMELHKMTTPDPEAMKKMQKQMWATYAIQFVLALFQAYVLAHYIAGWTDVSGIQNALWIWSGFILPLCVTNVIWTQDSKKVMWQKFLIAAGYQLVMFVIYGFVLGFWR